MKNIKDCFCMNNKMSSIIHAILFYSKRNKKSLELMNIAKGLNLDMELISVDSEKVRELLLNDDRYGIDRVPCILLIYDNGQFKTFINHALDLWFSELIENVKQQQQQQQYQSYQPFEQQITPIDDNPFVEEEPSMSSKPLNGSKSFREIKSTLPAPGRIKTDSIGGVQTVIEIEGEKPHVSKEVKKEGPSPSEIAQQLAAQREAMEEQIEAARTF